MKQCEVCKLAVQNNIKEYFRLKKQIERQEKKLSIIRNQQDDIFLEPFKTRGIFTNASYILQGMFEDKEIKYTSASSLFRKGSGGMYWSDETMRRHLPKIFKHFKEVGILVKNKKGYWELHPQIKENLK